jgi:hypothetical protein
MLKVIPDKAEVSLDFPDKAYVGTFGRGAHFDATTDADGVTLKLDRRDDQRRVVDVHLHHGLFADILEALAASVAAQPPIDPQHRAALLEGARHLVAALKAKR